MNIQTYLWCFLAACLGLLFNLFAVKIPSVKARAIVANMPFSYGQYFKDDATAIISSFLTILIYLFLLKELVAWKPVLVPYIIGASVFIGFTGASLLIAVLGVAQGKINSVVNVKTDISDGKVPPDTPIPNSKTV